MIFVYTRVKDYLTNFKCVYNMPKFQRCNEIISYHAAYHIRYKLSQMDITRNLVNYNLLNVKPYV